MYGTYFCVKIDSRLQASWRINPNPFIMSAVIVTVIDVIFMKAALDIRGSK